MAKANGKKGTPQMAKLFLEYDRTHTDVVEAKLALDRAMAERSAVVQAIATLDKGSQGNGKFLRNGAKLTIATRSVKREDGSVAKTTYYLRKEGDPGDMTEV